MSKKLLFLTAALAALLVCSCKELEVTPTSWLKKLSDEKVRVRGEIVNYQQTRATYTTTMEELKRDGFNVTALNATGDSMWSAIFNWKGSVFEADSAFWTKAGAMSFYASYPEKYKFDAKQRLVTTESRFDNDDPIVGFTKSDNKKGAVNIDLYHILCQVRAKVVNNSDFEIWVSAELASYFRYGTFTWKEPTDFTSSYGIAGKKLPADCWNLGDMKTNPGFVSKAVGYSVGTKKAPLKKGEGGTSIAQNIVPVAFPGGMISNPLGESEYPSTRIKFTVSYQRNGVVNSMLVEKEITELRPGVAYDFILEVSGVPEEPVALLTTAAIDDWMNSEDIKKFDCINDVACKVNVSVNDETMGYVSRTISGETVTITATANDKFRFNRWSDGNTSKSRTFNVNDEVDIVAEFGEDWLYVYMYIWWADGQYSKMSRDSEMHVWKGTLEVTEAPMTVWLSNKTKTTQSNRVVWGFAAEGQNYAESGTLTEGGYGLIFPETGKYDIVFNEKTLTYSVTKQTANVDALVDQLKSLIASCESDDPNDYDYTAESLAAYNAALAAAKEALTSTDATAIKAAYDALLAAFNGLTTGSTTAIIPDISA